MSGDFETLEINQPKIKYLKPEDNTEWLDKLIHILRKWRTRYQKILRNLRKKLLLVLYFEREAIQ